MNSAGRPLGVPRSFSSPSLTSSKVLLSRAKGPFSQFQKPADCYRRQRTEAPWRGLPRLNVPQMKNHSVSKSRVGMISSKEGKAVKGSDRGEEIRTLADQMEQLEGMIQSNSNKRWCALVGCIAAVFTLIFAAPFVWIPLLLTVGVWATTSHDEEKELSDQIALQFRDNRSLYLEAWQLKEMKKKKIQEAEEVRTKLSGKLSSDGAKLPVKNAFCLAEVMLTAAVLC